MSKKIAFLTALVVAAFALGLVVRGGGGSPAAGDGHDHAAEAGPTTWTCSMHPQIQLPEFGQCPICFMDLIPLEDKGGFDLGPSDLALSESALALAEIRTVPAQRRAVEKEVRLTGKVTLDETRTRVITARVAGRLDRLLADFTGRRVKAGEVVAQVYSPRLYQARVELLSARQAVQRGEPGAQENLDSVRLRLRLWDLDPDLVAASKGEHVAITAPVGGTVVHKQAVEGAYVGEGQPLLTVADLGVVWVELDAFERDLMWLAPGRPASFTVTALPGREFTGTVVFVDPVLEGDSRTAKVRLEAENPEGLLRPGMLARGVVTAALGDQGLPGRTMTGHTMTDKTLTQPRLPLVVPASAPLLTGERAVVYVRKPGDEPVFSGRQVVLGPRAGDWYVVREGLAEGELVVTNGAFKLDSALQITAAPSMMNPPHEGPHEDSESPVQELEVPECFAGLAVNMVPAYMDLQSALAGDDPSAARAAAGKLSGLLGDHCREAIPALVQAAEQVGEGSDLAAMRVAFQPLSDTLWAMIEQTGWQGEQTLRRFHCPMAFDNTGADWLQLVPETANPYFGAAMYRCGSEVAHLDAQGKEES